ncbi:MAG: M43 family zinc metalloprotease [Bacteroidia bacterium]
MKKLHLLFLMSIFSLQIIAQQSSIIPCYTSENLQELISKDPTLNEKINQFENDLAEYKRNPITQKSVRIIPTVVHVIHMYGSENISKAQIENQIATLNEDMRRLNSDATNTPAPFASVAADCQVEFRLARIDPNGNCTDGIVRVYSPLTNGPVNRDDVKAVSYWPSNKYFNIWVVKNIDNGGQQGTILGYAQFPGFGPATTDGVVIRADYFGSIETGNSGYKGRTTTHEVGHWLGLRHIWGDQTCGNDNVSDTPPHFGANSGCPSFPYNANNSCGAGANGEMYMNYMDYTNGGCQNLFTQGQKAVMDFVLNGTRANLWSASNLAATGVDGSVTGICAPKADFRANNTFICQGQSITFTDLSWNGPVTTRNWTFTGGTPSTSSDSMPVITYNTPGVYPVSLTVSNGAGNNTKTVTNFIYVSASPGGPTPFFDSFENAQPFPNNSWIVNNPDNGTTWTVSSAAGSTGVYSARITNGPSNANNVDELISTTYNMSGVTSASIKFKVAYAQRSSSTNDILRLFVSGNCGQTWALRWTQSGSTLATAPATSSSFIPTATQWKEITVSNIPATSFTSNFRFKFNFESKGGNNIYIDDINLSIISSIYENSSIKELSIYPNPSNGLVNIEYTSEKELNTTITIHDLTGRLVLQQQSQSIVGNNKFTINENSSLRTGMYLISLENEEGKYSQRLIIE